MRSLLVIASAVLACVFASTVSAQPPTEHATLVRRRIVLTRPPALAKEFPQRRQAVVSYPVISGIRNFDVLRKVRELLDVKNVFGMSLDEYRSDSWLTEFDYRVNHNGNFILDITFTQSGLAAYPDSHSKHFTIDLKTGTELNANDVFIESARSQLAALVNRKLKLEVASKMAQAKLSSDDSDFANLKEALAQLEFEPEHLDDFSVGRAGITFFYDAGFPHVIEALEPKGRYFFSYAEVKPFIKADGPLGPFLR